MIKTIKSMKYAIIGLVHIVKERNFKMHLLATIATAAVAIAFEFSRTDTLILLLVINNVLSAESFNTAIEEVTDLQRDKQGLSYDDVGKAKDIAAGAVLINAIMAAVIGILLITEYVGT